MDIGRGNSYTLQTLLQGSSYVRRPGSAYCGSAGGAPIGDAPPRIKEDDLRGPRLLIAKFRSRDGNRGVFFFISDSSFTESPSSHTMFRATLPEDDQSRSTRQPGWGIRTGLETAIDRRRIRGPGKFYRVVPMTILIRTR